MPGAGGDSVVESIGAPLTSYTCGDTPTRRLKAEENAPVSGKPQTAPTCATVESVVSRRTTIFTTRSAWWRIQDNEEEATS